MKFIITRTSQIFGTDDLPPCRGAEKEEHYWTIEISDLDELILLKKETNEAIILKKSMLHNELLELEVYDDYRE